jgi:hypothetical protein
LVDYLKEKLMSICKLNALAVVLALCGAGFTAHARLGGEGGMSGIHMSEEGREYKKSNPKKKHMNPDSDMRR